MMESRNPNITPTTHSFVRILGLNQHSDFDSRHSFGILVSAVGYWLLAFCLAGCSTQDDRSLLGPWTGERFQESPIQLSAYKSVQQRWGGQDANLALAVCISGGGHRAGNFGAGVLLGLEELTNGDANSSNALREVDYFSTVSGGGLAAAAYISSLCDYQSFHGSPEGYTFARALSPSGASIEQQNTDPDLRNHLEYNYINDIVRGIFTIVMLDTVHRGDFMENSFDDHILGRLWRQKKMESLKGGGRDYHASLTLGDLFVERDANTPVRMPYWVTNATAYENAAIFPFAPDQIKLYQLCGYTHRLGNVSYDASKSSYDRFVCGVPLSVGLSASGSFPVALPAQTMKSTLDPRNPYLHLLDGGVSDNFGVTTAVRLLGQDAVARRKVLLMVDAYNGPLTPFSNCEQSPAMMVMAFRVASGFLDAWRTRSREMVRAMCKSQCYPGDIEVVFLSLDDLADCKDVKELEKYGFLAADLDQLKREWSIRGNEVTPFALARHVQTTYMLTATEQTFLLAVGRYVVFKKRDEIRKAIGWDKN